MQQAKPDMTPSEQSVPVAQAQVVYGQPVAGAAFSQAQPTGVAYAVPQYAPASDTTTYVVQTQYVPQMIWGAYPQRVICPICHYDVITGTVKEVGPITHLWAIGLCVVGCWPFCLLPYCIDTCQDTVHFCPNCKNQIGMSHTI